MGGLLEIGLRGLKEKRGGIETQRSSELVKRRVEGCKERERKIGAGCCEDKRRS